MKFKLFIKKFAICFFVLLAALIFALMLFLCFNVGIWRVFADEQNKQYAQILNNDVCLYRSTLENSSFENKYFILPKTYFVELLADEGNFYLARYMNTVGYVKKAEIQCVKGAPANPFPAGRAFSVMVQEGLQLRKEPSQNAGLASVVVKVPYLSHDLMCYGEIEGEEVVPMLTNKWYYCKYDNGQEYYGYLYSGYCYLLDPLVENKEVLEHIDSAVFETAQASTFPTNEFSGLSTGAQILIVVGVCVPCLIVVYLLFRPNKILQAASVSEKKSKRFYRKRKKHQDYYEIDN